MTLPIPWLKQAIQDHLDWVSTVIVDDGKVSTDQFLDLWTRWLIAHDFVKVYGPWDDPRGYLIARPVRMEWVFNADINYFDTLFDFDRAGQVVWIDSLWAKGFYPRVLMFLKSTQKPFVAWDHKHKLYFKRIDQLSGGIPDKSEIAEAFVRNV
jgi:hypothetical protein